MAHALKVPTNHGKFKIIIRKQAETIVELDLSLLINQILYEKKKDKNNVG